MKKRKKRSRRLKAEGAFVIAAVLIAITAGIYYVLTRPTDAEAVLASQVNTDSIVVLAYHHIVSDEEKASAKLKDNAWTVSTSEFEQQLDYLFDEGYNTVTLEELYSWYKGELVLPEKSFVITFDDGYLSGIRYAIPILKKFDYVSTMFIIGWQIRDNKEVWDPNTLQAMSAEDMNDSDNKEAMSFYSHTYGLHHYINGKAALQTKTKDEIVEDFKWSQKVNSIDFVAYPFGASSDTYIEVEKEMGVKMAFEFGTDRPATREDNPYLMPRYCIKSGMPIDRFKAIFATPTDTK